MALAAALGTHQGALRRLALEPTHLPEDALATLEAAATGLLAAGPRRPAVVTVASAEDKLQNALRLAEETEALAASIDLCTETCMLERIVVEEPLPKKKPWWKPS